MLPGARHVSAVALVVGVAAGACGPASSGVEGVTCTVDTDCNSGLACLLFYAYATSDAGDGGCTTFGRVCQQSCKSTSDCTLQGYVCATSCGGSPTCMPPGAAADAAADAVPGSVPDSTGDVTSE